MIRERTDRLILVASFFAALTYLGASGDYAAMLPVLIGLVGARIITGKAGSGMSLPTGMISLAVLGVMGVILAVALVRGFDIELFSRLIALLMTLKAFERRAARDLSQMLMLAVFLMIGALLTDSGLLVGIGLLAIIPLLVISSMSLQMLFAGEQADTPTQRLTPGGRVSFRRTALIVTGIGVASSIGVFLVIPRGLAQQAFGDWGQVSLGDSTVGFDDEIDLDIGGLISDSQTPVLDLQVLDDEGKQLGQVGKHFYLRGAVLDLYEDRKWKSSPPDRNEEIGGFAAGTQFVIASNSRTRRNDWSFEQRVLIRNAEGDRSYVFGSWEPLSIRFDQNTSIRSRRDVGTARFESSPGKVGYTLQVRGAREDGDLKQYENRARPALTVEFPSSEVRSYAEDLLTAAQISPDPLTRGIMDDRRVARAFESHLWQQFQYTLSPNSPPDEVDPIEWFLLQEQAGHCEFFASAMAAMCRSVGINARVVTGYLATEYNEMTGYYLVRESNAHAWVEVQIIPGESSRFPESDPGIWEKFDPTPPGVLWSIHDPKPGLVTKIKQLFETAEFAWISSVVGFGTESQRSMVGDFSLPPWFRLDLSRAEQRINDGNRKLIAIALVTGIAAFATSILLMSVFKVGFAALVGRLGWGAIRLSIPSRSKKSRRPRSTSIDRAYTQVLRSLSKRGVPKPAGVPLRRHVLSCGDAITDPIRSAYLRAAAVLYQAEFSGSEITETQRTELRAAVREAASRSK